MWYPQVFLDGGENVWDAGVFPLWAVGLKRGWSFASLYWTVCIVASGWFPTWLWIPTDPCSSLQFCCNSHLAQEELVFTLAHIQTVISSCNSFSFTLLSLWSFVSLLMSQDWSVLPYDSIIAPNVLHLSCVIDLCMCVCWYLCHQLFKRNRY